MRTAARLFACLTFCALTAILAAGATLAAGDRSGKAAGTIQFSFRTYANNVRVVAPLVGRWQLGKARLHGSGSLNGNNITGTVVSATDPLYDQYPPASLRAEVIGYRYYQAAHNAYRKLTLTIEVTSAVNGGENCVEGTRGVLTLYDSARKLSNGERADYVTMNHWTGNDCPTFVMGWTNEDGGARTRPAYGGPPHGGQWAIVRISS